MAENIYERIISIDTIKQTQTRLTINEFREVEYLHLRKYYLDFDEDWKPSNEGISIPLTIEASQELLSGLLEILSLAESKELIEEHFLDIIKTIYEY